MMDSVCKKIISDKRIPGENETGRGVIKRIPVDEDLERVTQSIVGAEETAKNNKWGESFRALCFEEE